MGLADAANRTPPTPSKNCASDLFSSSATGTAYDDDDTVISMDTAMCDSVRGVTRNGEIS
jgi:hypothetical protein